MGRLGAPRGLAGAPELTIDGSTQAETSRESIKGADSRITRLHENQSVKNRIDGFEANRAYVAPDEHNTETKDLTDSTSSIKIIYQNIHGLDLAKLRHIECLLEKERAVFIMAEHWFVDFDKLLQSPLLVTSNRLPTNPRLNGHQNGGLAILASLEIQNEINLIQNTEQVISFKIGQETISSLYLRPSLTLEETHQTLYSLPSTTIVLGDINVRFGKETRDKRTWNLDRGAIINEWMSCHGLQMQLCDQNCSRNDHLFSRMNLRWEYTWMDPKTFRSDHGRMELLLATRLDQRQAEPRVKRFAYSLLREPIISKLLGDLFETSVYPQMTDLCSALRRFVELGKVGTRDDIQELVDDVYGRFTHEIRRICESLLPEYDPEAVKKQKDNSLALQEKISNAHAVRAFKRSQRSFASSQVIKPRDTRKTANEEAQEFYQSLYQGTQATITYNLSNVKDDFMPSLTTLSDEKISKAIMHYSTAKAGGPDGIDTRLLKCLNTRPSFSRLLEKLFDVFVFTGVTPTDWNQSRIHLLIKDQDEPFADKTRPIALTNVLRRIFEKLLLSDWLKSDWSHLSKYQAGFRKGWSTISHILLSDDLSRTGYRVSAFLDLKNAFDRVPHQKLIWILKNRGCGPRILNLVYSLMMNNCRSVLSVNRGAESQPFCRSTGVFQGSILSPFLFNLFIDSLASLLNNGSVPDTISLFFADDIVIKGKSRRAVQRVLDICARWASEHDMTWGIAKCGAMGKGKDGSFTDISHVTLGTQSLPEVAAYKYLGVPHVSSGVDWESYCQKIIAKHNGLLNATLLHRKPWLLHTRVTIYKVFIRPTLEYCVAPMCVWINKQRATTRNSLWKQLQDSHSMALNWIFDFVHAKRVLENMAGLGDINSRIFMLQGSLARHLRTLDKDNPLSSHMQLNPISSSANFILPFCMKSSLLDSWMAQPNGPRRLSWRTWWRREWMARNKECDGILQHFILSRSRTRALVDKALSETLQTAIRAVKWRSNRLFSRSKCPVCLELFTHAHLTRCNLLSRLDPKHSLTLEHERFKKDLEQIAQELDQKRVYSFHYTPLDFYLNERDFDHFNDAIDSLKLLLHEQK